MPHTVEQLRTREGVDMAYILLIDGIPIAFTTDTSGELTGSGPNSFIGRAEADAGEAVGAREIQDSLIVGRTLEFGGQTNSIGIERNTARFSFLIGRRNVDGHRYQYLASDYFILGGEDPEEMLGHLPPTADPAPPTVVGVTVRDRYLGLERIGPNGERRMFPFVMGEDLAGFDHHGDTDGGTVPASVSVRPLVQEGRLCALYRVYRDPSATSTANSDSWPSLSNYRPIWVGKLRDAGTIDAGSRMKVSCTGFETLLERNMATGGGVPFNITPEFSTSPGVDDQVAIWFGSGPQIQPGFEFQTAGDTYQGRNWTTLGGTTYETVRGDLHLLIQSTLIGEDTDYETGASAAATVEGIEAGFQSGLPDIYIRKDRDDVLPIFFAEMRIAMHRKRWLALGFDPEQQDVEPDNSYGLESTQQIRFHKLSSGDVWRPRSGDAPMGPVPSHSYYMGIFNTIPVGTEGIPTAETSFAAWDNDGSRRYYSPIFTAGGVIVINNGVGQIIRISDSVVLLPQNHVPFSGSIDGTPCDAAGYFKLTGKIRRAEGSTDDQSLVVDEEDDFTVIARCSWVRGPNTLFADIGDGVAPALYVEDLHDPRKFGYPFRPLDRDWAATQVKMQQIFTWALGTQSSSPERAAQTLSALLRSTGTAVQSGGIIQQGVNAGTSTGFYGDIFSPEMGLGIPDSLLPTQAEILSVFNDLPNGSGGQLGRCRPVYETSFPSYDALEALLQPRGIRIGFANGRFNLYRLQVESPGAATVNILESDLYGEMGDPTTVYPTQATRYMAPADGWEFEYAKQTHLVRARDPNAPFRRGDFIEKVNGHGLVAPELYVGDSSSIPQGGRWKEEAFRLFGGTIARFVSRRHHTVSVRVSRPKGQDIYPGTVVTLSNPWVWGADGTQGVSGVAGIVQRCTHNTDSSTCDADILVFEGQETVLPHFAPCLRISAVNSSTELVIDTSSDVPSIGSLHGWTQPVWNNGESGNLRVSLMRMLPDTRWTVVGDAEFGSTDGTTVTLATPLSAMPPLMARTMLLVPDVWSNQPGWAQDMYSAIGLGSGGAPTPGCKKFV